jgi:2'-5' RNA ligase
VNAFVSKKRIFFALWPSQKQRKKIEAAIEPYKAALAGKWTDRDNWHVTLVFIGSFPGKDIAALQAAASRIQCPAISLGFERIDYWKRPKIMCLLAGFVPNPLTDLVNSLQSVAGRFGFEPEKRPYRPHMTIARKAGFFEPIVLAQPLTLQWSRFELVESISTPSGVQYKPLKQ